MTRRVFAVILAVAIGLPLVVLSIWLGAKYVLPATLNMARGMFAAEPPAISAPAATPTPIDVKALAAAVVAALPTPQPAPVAGNTGSPVVQTGSESAGQPVAVAAAVVQPQSQLNAGVGGGQPEIATVSGGQPAQPEVLAASVSAPSVQADMVPAPPYFGTDGQDIIDVANYALSQWPNQKRHVFPREMNGGDYDKWRSEYEAAVLQGANVSFGTTDKWSVFAYPGQPGDPCAWYYPVTREAGGMEELRQGFFSEVVFANGQRTEITSPAFRVDTMMSTCEVDASNVGVRSIPKNAGVKSYVLRDGQTSGYFATAFAVAPWFAENFTGGNSDLVPAVILNGMPGQNVQVQYYGPNGNMIKEESRTIESTNGTISVEVPTDGSFVLLAVPVIGTNDNANTEVLLRMGSQPKSDIPGKNWVSFR